MIYTILYVRGLQNYGTVARTCLTTEPFTSFSQQTTETGDTTSSSEVLHKDAKLEWRLKATWSRYAARLGDNHELS